ncbi:MAG: hypothetical protein ACPGN3_17395 [Opitutales bacterium]
MLYQNKRSQRCSNALGILALFFDFSHSLTLFVELITIAIAVNAERGVVKQGEALVELERPFLAELYQTKCISAAGDECANGAIQFVFEGI